MHISKTLILYTVAVLWSFGLNAQEQETFEALESLMQKIEKADESLQALHSKKGSYKVDVSDSVDSSQSIWAYNQLLDQISSLQKEIEFAMGYEQVIILNKRVEELSKTITIFRSDNPSQFGSPLFQSRLNQQLEELIDLVQMSSDTFHEVLNGSDFLKNLKGEYLKNKSIEKNFFNRVGLDVNEIQSIELLEGRFLQRYGGTPEDFSSAFVEKLSQEIAAFESEKKALILQSVRKNETVVSHNRKSLVGGSFSILPSKPIKISLSADYIKPVSYRWALGFGILADNELKAKKLSQLSLTNRSWGGRGILNYHISPRYFLEGSYEMSRYKVSIVSNGSEPLSAEWKDETKIGLGRFQRIGNNKVLRLVLLYTPSTQRGTSRLEFRTGIYIN